MNKNEQKVLQGSTVYFTDHIKMKDKVIIDLIQAKVFHEYDWEAIKCEEDDQKAVQVFVERLCKSGPEAFGTFLNVLIENEQGFIAAYLQKQLSASSLYQRGVDFPIKDFQERKDVTCLIDNVLNNKGVAILTGLNGSGKTQLARRTVQSFVDENLSGFHATLSGQSLGTLETSLGNIVNCQDLGPAKHKSDIKRVQYLLQELFKMLSTMGASLLMIDDVTEESAIALSEVISDHPSSVLIIMTTNNATLFRQYAIPVIGFSEEEALSFFLRLAIDEFPEIAVKRLCKTLSYNPLGLHIAISYINRTSCGIESYIRQLETHGTNHKAEPQLASYSKTLVAVIQLTIGSVKVGSPIMFFLASCLMFFYPATISEEIVRHVCHVVCVVLDPTLVGDLAQIVDNLVSELRKTSLCLVSGMGPNRIFQVHEVVRLVWLKGFTRAELQSQFKTSLKALVGFCSMDTRLSENFKSLCQTQPHLESVVSYRKRMDIVDDKECLVLYSQVCNFLGHFYKHNNQPEKAVAILNEGFECFYSIFPHSYIPPTEKQTFIGLCGHYLKKFFGFLWHVNISRHVAYQGPPSNPKVIQKARNFFHLSKEFPPEIAWLQNYVCSKKHRTNPGTSHSNTKPEYITWNDYTKQGIYVSVETLQSIYLIDIFMSLAYTYGRVYHYSDKTRVSSDEKEDYVFHLQLVLELGKMVSKEHGVSLSLEMLCQKYGLMYIMLEKEGKTKQQYCSDLVKVKDYYSKLQKDKRKWFYMGVSSPIVNDEQHEAACMRTVIQSLRRLVELGEKAYLDELKEQMSLFEGKLNGMKERGLIKKLDRPSSFYNELAQCYLCVGDVEKARELFQDVIDSEKESKLIPYTLNEATEGIVKCYVAIKNPQKAYECIEEYNTIINDFSGKAGNNSIFKKALGDVDELRKYVDSFNKAEISVSVATPGCNV